MWWLIVAPVLIVFLFTDASYFIRYLTGVYFQNWKAMEPFTSENLHKPVISHHIVLPGDIDPWMHMNNSKYLREGDFGRLEYCLQRGILAALGKTKTKIVASSISIRYRRELRLFQTYTIETSTLYWDDKHVYMEQKFVRNGFVHAISLVQARFIGESPETVFKLCGSTQREPVAEPRGDLKAMLTLNEESSKMLRPPARSTTTSPF